MNNINYTIRVYGLVINTKGEILLSDELAFGKRITKLPGGGMEKGEGTLDTLHREFMEELQATIEIREHFYTTDFYQPALGKTEYQLMSIYYFVNIKTNISGKISAQPFDKKNFKPGDQTFRFVSIDKLKSSDLTLPIDQIVIQKLIQSKNLKS
ncbi:MAG: NUDIX domain-containing protein [Bacteroidota bacterium]|nr:NUDIX domain-containing protein [Bacteroidota bacterium]